MTTGRHSIAGREGSSLTRGTLVDEAWARHLDLNQIPEGANFFELGGDSLGALRVVADLNQAGLAASLRDFYLHPTVAAQEGRWLRAASVQQPEMATQLDEARILPLAPLQSALLVEAASLGDADPYWMMAAYRLPFDISIEMAVAAWRATVAANPALRTRLVLDGLLVGQIISRSSDAAALIHVQDAGLSQPKALATWCQARIRELGGERLRRLAAAWLVESPSDQQAPAADRLLVIAVHHVVIDGWSMAQVLADFTEFLDCGLRSAPDPRPSLADYFAWQDRSGAVATATPFWQRALAGVEAAEELSFSRGRVPGTDGAAAMAPREILRKLSPTASAGYARFCSSNGVTQAAMIAYQWSRILAQYQSGDDICLGLTVNIRPAALTGATDISGCLLNVVPVIVPGGQADAVAGAANLMLDIAEATEHGCLPHAAMLQVASLPAMTELFASTVVFQNFAGDTAHLGGARPGTNGIGAKVYGYEAEGTADPLCLTVDFGDRTMICVEWDDQRYDGVVVRSLLAALEYWIYHPAQMAEDVPANGWTTPAERHAGVLGHPASAAPWSIDRYLNQSGDLLAVSDESRAVTYAELRHDANLMATYLREVCRLEPGMRVAFVGRRDTAAAIAICGAWLAGLSWCAIDAAGPERRRADVVDELEPGVVVDLRDESWRAVAPVSNVRAATFEPTSPAYFVATSGSTGRPKIVAIAAGGLTGLVEAWHQTYSSDGAPEVVLQIGSWTSDVFLGDLLKALSTGGHLVICPDGRRVDTANVEQLMRVHGVTLVESTPALITAIFRHLGAGSCPPALRTVIVGSDTFRLAELAELTELMPPEVRLFNGYGLSECTIESLVLRCERHAFASRSGLCPLGAPLPGTVVSVVDSQGWLCPPGATGELRVSGPQVGLGYHSAAAVHAVDKFSDWQGMASFRTGDRALIDHQGVVHFFGRADSQLKIRGHRVEAGEIENAVLRVSGVREAFAFAVDRIGGPAICAWLGGAAAGDAGKVRSGLAHLLPEYAIPALYGFLPELPRTKTGKIDRLNLAARTDEMISAASQRAAGAPDPDGSGLARTVAGIWEEVLGTQVGAGSSFFDSGGNSIMMITLHEKMRAQIPGFALSIADLFRQPTMSSLIHRLAEDEQALSATPGDRPSQSSAEARRGLLEAVQRGAMSAETALPLLGGQ
jgi:amino acid adenylation domain-containing protein